LTIAGVLTLPFRALAVVITCSATLFAWVFFRAYDLQSAKLITGAMLGSSGADISRVAQASQAGMAETQALLDKTLALADFSWLQKIMVFALEAQKISWGVAGTLLTLTALLLIVWFTPNTQQIFARYQPALDCPADDGRGRWRFGMSWRAGLLAGLIFFVALSQLFSAAPSEFMYFNF